MTSFKAPRSHIMNIARYRRFSFFFSHTLWLRRRDHLLWFLKLFSVQFNNSFSDDLHRVGFDCCSFFMYDVFESFSISHNLPIFIEFFRRRFIYYEGLVFILKYCTKRKLTYKKLGTFLIFHIFFFLNNKNSH
jgi:hypothetical protein